MKKIPTVYDIANGDMQTAVFIRRGLERYRSNRGGRKVMRRLSAPAWSQSARNYPSTTRQMLEPLMADLPAVLSGGRLILWNGPPGTGKTSALRTLARESGEAILLEYVLDPDTFFGNDSGYFVGVLFNDDEEADERQTRLLVLEDCDDLLVADSKHQGGQGLARLLNLVDGLIGQGLRIGVLITTNDPLSGFHPAVTRPGRSGAAISFEAFDKGEADTWLAGEGVEATSRDRTTLAELLALRAGRELPQLKAPIGFLTTPNDS